MLLHPRMIAAWCLVAAGLPTHPVSPAQAVGASPAHVECASLTALQLPNTKVTEALAVAAREAGTVRTSHCRVSGVIDKEIRFTELLPDRWNERLFAGGGGGFVGSVENMAVASVNAGYATVGTDTGHEGDGTDARWALGNQERKINFGYLAIHRT
ncbi:MAG TPA: tannase/feruloyl esterase family alpha/beta hydrolase, partial [Vicinamibacterales bacterium]|nr:tannase/feruloyl esterase family alpha/beta hydrolase [Vicinamibacterales bacterium]